MMTSRERILAAINHQQPDRVPVDLSATPSSGISAIAYSNLIKHIGRQELPVQIYDVVQQLAQPDMTILDQFGVDVLDIGQFHARISHRLLHGPLQPFVGIRLAGEMVCIPRGAIAS